MLKRFYDWKLVHRVIIYLRMSSDQQNPRSPDQQLEQIKRRLAALGYKWIIVKIYRDDAKSGRYLHKRPGYQKMMRDIRTGAVKADLILVDTLERFGRVEELPMIRKELFEKHGVLVLTADSDFADPTKPTRPAGARRDSAGISTSTRISLSSSNRSSHRRSATGWRMRFTAGTWFGRRTRRALSTTCALSRPMQKRISSVCRTSVHQPFPGNSGRRFGPSVTPGATPS